ncbi:VpaChn25_0724 family phage protein [Shimia aestuarii]|jgi:hypothetical protein|uniref:VpaChn25_0724 family phage protein n=1 Tax=Shimia aestuarii TaxID=254406 RepID=UPI003D72B148
MSNRKNETTQILQQHRSLAILRFLSRSPEYRSNEDVLLDWLRHLALTCTRAELRTLASSLEGDGHLRSEIVEELHILKLAEKGLETAEGKTISEGVKRPEPECPY